MEIWKSVKDFADYEVSDLGRVRSVKKLPLKILNMQRHTGGYSKVCFWVKGKCFNKFVHTLVLEAFMGERPEGHQACHGNGDKKDNRLVNLRWDTRSNNQLDREAHGTGRIGRERKVKTLNPETVLKIRECVERNGGNKTKSAKELGMSRTTVADVANRRTWKHI